MANSYLLFSVEIPGLTKKEVAWFQKQLTCPDEELFIKWPEAKQQAWLKEHGTDDLSCYPDFGYEFDPDGTKQSLILYSEECGNLDQVCNMLQSYLKTFHPDRHIGVEWATTCSKMRPGEFSGGAVFITAQEQRCMNSGTWLYNVAAAWQRRKDASAKQVSKKRR